MASNLLYCVRVARGPGGGVRKKKAAPFPAPHPVGPASLAPPPWPRLPAPAPPPAPPPPRPASGRGPFLPQLVLCGRGAARRRLYGRGSERKGEKGRECGRRWGLGRGAEARPGLPHVHSTLQAGPGLSHRQASRSRIKALEGRARARPRAVLGADPPPRSRGPARGGDPRGEQCSLGSGSRLLASGGIEGELVLELQRRDKLDLRRSKTRGLSRTVDGEALEGGALGPEETAILLGRGGCRLH